MNSILQMDDALFSGCLVLVVIILIYLLFRMENFTSPEQLNKLVNQGSTLLANGAPYSRFKQELNADPVEYKMAKKLYMNGALTVENLNTALNT